MQCSAIGMQVGAVPVAVLAIGILGTVASSAHSAEPAQVPGAQITALERQIKAVEDRIVQERSEATSLRAQVDRVNAEAAEFDSSPEEMQKKQDLEGYQASCAGKMLYGAQIGYCDAWAARVRPFLEFHNAKMNAYMEQFNRLNRQADELNATIATDTTQLNKLQSDKAALISSQKAATSVAGSGTTAAFGKGGPANPDLKAPERSTHIRAKNSAEALSSVHKSGQRAKAAASAEEAKERSGCGFDNGLCDTPDAIRVAKTIAQTPAAVELASHLPDKPEIKNDPAIAQSLAWFDKLERTKGEHARRAAEIQNQIDSGHGDMVVLKAKLGTFQNALKQDQTDQAKAVAQIKKRLVAHRSPWIENPSSSGTGVATSPVSAKTGSQ